MNKREECVTMLAQALALAICAPDNEKSERASDLAGEIAGIGLGRGYIAESDIETAKALAIVQVYGDGAGA
jgi:Tfp pilus assembly protein PilF